MPVVDAGDEDHEQHVDAVSRILADLELAEKPRLLAFNKCDGDNASLGRQRASSYRAYPISALEPATLSDLLGAIERELWLEGKASG